MKDDKKKEKQEEAKKENKEVIELKNHNEDLENSYKRALADYQNLEKRIINERKEWIITSNKELILRLLPVLDTLMMAEKHVKNEGLSLSIKQFLDVLKSEGVIRIETLNKEFNPQTMECVETKEGKEGQVLEEVRAGYMLGDKVLRAAQTVVGKQEIDKKEEELAKEELSREAGSGSDGQKGDYM